MEKKKIKGKNLSITALAKKMREKKLEGSYYTGDENDLVWINFQVPKGLKRELSLLRKRNNNLNVSDIVRKFLRQFIDSSGDLSKVHFGG